MEFKGTKGNWVAELGNSKNVNVTAWINEKANGFIHSQNVSDFDDRQEAQANAKLIACAPEMLEILNKLHLLLEEHQPNWYLLGHHNEILELIKKATTI